MNEKMMTLGTDWQGQNPAGWFMSEKLDGCRAYWDGLRFWTRGGEVIAAPDWFTKGLPRCHLDGEIYAGRGGLQRARCATQYGGEHFNNGPIYYKVFDCPTARGVWVDRLIDAAQLLGQSRYATIVGFTLCDSRGHLQDYLHDIQSNGGEGVMLRNPHVTRYEIGRTANLLKVKTIIPNC